MIRRLFLWVLLALAVAQPVQAQTFVSSTGVQKVNNVGPDATGNVTIATTQFVSGFTPGASGTVANLLATAPCNASIYGQYASVSDLYNNGVAGGGIDDILRCRLDAGNSVYRWTPQREAYNGASAATGGTITITPLITPPTMRFTGTLLSGLTITPSSANAYVGLRHRILMQGTLGAFVGTITGLIGSNITLLGGNSATIEYGPTGWFSAGN
jgi:hypothetical protein